MTRRPVSPETEASAGAEAKEEAPVHGRREEDVRGSEPRSPSPPAEAVAPPADAGAPPADAAASSAAAVSEGALEARLADAEAKRDEYLDLLQRLQADFENYRKRAVRDQERLVAHAHERVVRELLPVLDDLERALDAAERHEEATLVEGVKLVEQALRAALEREGLVEIETNGAFDPHVHEAILTQERDGIEAGSVLEVVQRGYRLGDKVVRPARVIVAA